MPYPGSVLLDISPVLVKLNNIQMLQLDKVVKNSFDFFLLIGGGGKTGQTFKTKLSKAVLVISAERAWFENVKTSSQSTSFFLQIPEKILWGRSADCSQPKELTPETERNSRRQHCY